MENRIVKLNSALRPNTSGRVVYVMSRDQRVRYNHALILAAKYAQDLNTELEVVFCLNPNIKNGNLRSYMFMIEGLKDVERELNALGISFTLLYGSPINHLREYFSARRVAVAVTDFSPLRYARKWRLAVAKYLDTLEIPFYEVDTHNILPVRFISPKQEYSAYTLRLKINRVLDTFLKVPDDISNYSYRRVVTNNIDWGYVIDWVKSRVDGSVLPSHKYKGGIVEAYKTLDSFILSRLNNYAVDRNNPVKNALSDLSPYLHFGNISSLEVVLKVRGSGMDDESVASYIEEVVVRKELSDNYCYYNPNYDNPNGYPMWGRKSLEKHLDDVREHTYSLAEFEKGLTDDELWNVAQLDLVENGKMHGYLRMYWAKKVLEWSVNYREAHNVLIYLNDKYSIDGRDPNGYVGISWSLGGLHDRPWFERPIFGTIRYMNLAGMQRKFKVQSILI